ncbi:HAD family hydrolase [Chromobacterium phragmitis]|uniref:HAD family hydrolase n=1 Tax=Chromobacterium phragmitis TaxID=2202141 RepID=UPI000DED11B8|nr:HAD hydrolase-like protein [Chromobacterium phragmitis]AXE31006.1 HAD family hydrolase [Chromobacterium phragmitis]
MSAAWLDGVSHLVFDWNGTLIDDIDLAVASVNRCCARFGAEPVTRERYRREFGFPIVEFYARLGFDFNRHPFADIVAVYLEHFDAYVARCPMQDSVAELLELAAARGIGASVLSASQNSVLLRTLDAKRLLGSFQHVVGLDHTHASGKRDEALALQARLALPPADTLFIGDTLHDCEVARHVGWRALLVETGHQDRARLDEGGVPVFASLAALVQALSAPAEAGEPS